MKNAIAKVPKNDRVVILIPAYNCENQISRVISQFNQSIAPWIDWIVIIDNRSSDHTVKNALNSLKSRAEFFDRNGIKCAILQNDQNFGLGGSHKVGFKFVKQMDYQYCVVLHGDDQANVEDLIPFLKNGSYKQYDAILGSRFLSGSSLHGYSIFRLLGNYFFLMLFSIFTGKITYDMGSGLNLYCKNTLRERDYFFSSDNLVFHCYFLLKMYSKSRKLKFIPISWTEEDQISNAKLFRQAYEIFKILILYRVDKNKFLEINYGKFGDECSYAYTEVIKMDATSVH